MAVDSYARTIAYLYGLQWRGMKFGLRGIRYLLSSIGNPHRHLATVHIAGTNGKGSTAALIASVYSAMGLKTGLYTSPHILDFSERIRVDGTPISREDVVAGVNRLKPFIERGQSTFFEAVTALAFHHFKRKNVDIVVLETGLGGRLDATNVVRPLVSVITGIGLEHRDLLGKTLRSIAHEKAGIIKKGIPVVSGVTQQNAQRVIRATSKRLNAPLACSSRIKVKPEFLGVTGSVATFSGGGVKLEKLFCELPGMFQLTNARTAIAALHVAGARRKKFMPSNEQIREGFSQVSEMTGFYGRLFTVRWAPHIVVDVAHNPQAIRALVADLQGLGFPPVSLVFGVVADKEYQSMVRSLGPLCKSVHTVQAGTGRSRKVSELTKEFRKYVGNVHAHKTVAEGVRMAVSKAVPGVPVLITGSHYVVAEALAHLLRRKYLTINQ